jgi:hypothetical protein
LKKEKTGDKKEKKHKKEKKAAEKERGKLNLEVILGEDQASNEGILKGLGRVQKLGKAKHWPGKTGGHKVAVVARIKAA